MIDKIYIKFLKNFFLLYDAHIESYSVIDKTIFGNVGWLGEVDKQEFKWEITINEKEALSLAEICFFIKSKKYNHNDKIIITEEQLSEELVKKYNWGKENVKILIELLLDVEIKMIDKGEETDSFFLHY